MHDTADDAGPGAWATLVMALACGVAAANVYYNQPVLGIMERAFPDTATLVGFVPTATQLGYAAGLIFLVPLGDRIERRVLILVQIGALVLALLAVALAPGPWTLVLGSGLVGICATVAQQIVPFAMDLAPPSRRGRMIGIVMSGLLCGILFGRTLAGFVGQHQGWRAPFLISIAITSATGALLALVLPRGEPRSAMRYPALLASLAGLIRTEPALRRAAAIQTALFASFTAFWTILALHLEQPPLRLGADVAGLFGLVGATGVLIAPLAGRLADRQGPRAGLAVGLALMTAAWIVFALWRSVAGLVVGVLLLDIGEQGTLILNQHVVFSLNPEARNRLNTVLVGGMFLGGACGSAGATLCWNRGGWPLVTLFGGGLVLVGLGIHVLARDEAPVAEELLP